jgi:hypothetical protein
VLVSLMLLLAISPSVTRIATINDPNFKYVFMRNPFARSVPSNYYTAV